MENYTQTSAPALAYLGDCVIELLVREHLVKKGFSHSSKLNEESRKFVTAVAQNVAYLKIENLLTEEEISVFKRGRNSSHLNIPKSASPTEYKNATGFEALFGYLKLKGDTERIYFLFSNAYADIL